MSINYFHSYRGQQVSLVSSNVGYGSILIEEIHINYDLGNVVYYIRKEIKKDEFFSISPNASIESYYHGLVGYHHSNDGIVVADIYNNATAWHEDEQIDRKDTRGCFCVFFVNKDADDISRMSKFYQVNNQELDTRNVDATVVFFGAHTGKTVRQKFAVVATYLLSNTSECVTRFPN